MRPPPLSTPFPYTTLFRSPGDPGSEAGCAEQVEEHQQLRQAGEVLHVPDHTLGDGDGEQRQLAVRAWWRPGRRRSEEHTSELQSRGHLVCRLLLEKKK